MDSSNRTVQTVLEIFTEFWILAVYTWVGLALLFFIWGVTKLIKAGGDEEKLSEAKKYIIWSLIGLFVIFSVWGIVGVLQNTFELDNSVPEDRINDLYEGALD